MNRPKSIKSPSQDSSSTISNPTPRAEESSSFASPLLRLPYELRRTIFLWSIDFSESSIIEQIYQRNLPPVYQSRPSPLLSTSRQTRRDMIDMLQRERQESFTLRVTPFGSAFDSYNLSFFVAMDLPNDSTSSLHALPFLTETLPQNQTTPPKVRIEVWPASTAKDRDKEMHCLYEHLRELRIILRSATQMIPRISIVLKECKYALWAESYGGVSASFLSGFSFLGVGSVKMVLGHFIRVDPLMEVDIEVAPSLKRVGVVATLLI